MAVSGGETAARNGGGGDDHGSDEGNSNTKTGGSRHRPDCCKSKLCRLPVFVPAVVLCAPLFSTPDRVESFDLLTLLVYSPTL